MKYTVLTIDNSREEKKADIHKKVTGLEYITVDAVHGRNPENLEYWTQHWYKEHGVAVTEPFGLKDTERAIWFGQLNCWLLAQDEDLLIFEDDAILSEDFQDRLDEVIGAAEILGPWDAISLFIPDDQTKDFTYNRVYLEDGTEQWNSPHHVPSGSPVHLTDSPILAKAYQGYGCVANIISREGARKLLDTARQRGINTPVDCFLFERGYKDDFTIYTPRPDYPRIAWVDWFAPSLRG